MSSRPPL